MIPALHLGGLGVWGQPGLHNEKFSKESRDSDIGLSVTSSAFKLHVEFQNRLPIGLPYPGRTGLHSFWNARNPEHLLWQLLGPASLCLAFLLVWLALGKQLFEEDIDDEKWQSRPGLCDCACVLAYSIQHTNAPSLVCTCGDQGPT